MLKDNGRNKHKVTEYIQCPKCRKKLVLSELEQDGYVEEVGKNKIIYCPSCDHEFIE